MIISVHAHILIIITPVIKHCWIYQLSV